MAHILIVDDEADIRDVLGRLFARLGHTTDLAEDGDQGIECVRSREYDLVVTDVRMPRMDGLEFLRAIRPHVQWRTPCMIVTAFEEARLAIEATRLGVVNFLVKPFEFVEIREAVAQALDHREAWKLRLHYEGELEVANANLQQELEEILKVLLREFAEGLESKADAAQHCARVATWTLLVADEMHVVRDEAHRRNIEMGALLHDLGKIKVPREIIAKEGPLTDGEWVEVRKHPDLGARIVEQIPRLAPAASIIRSHHERYDGDGYPQGLRATEIPLEARIFSVVDAFDCMLEVRSYKAAYAPDASLREIQRCAGTQFDPEVVRAFERVYPTILEAWTKNGGAAPTNGRVHDAFGTVARHLANGEASEDAPLDVALPLKP